MRVVECAGMDETWNDEGATRQRHAAVPDRGEEHDAGSGRSSHAGRSDSLPALHGRAWVHRGPM